MFGRRIKLFTLLGFEVKIDLSWLVIAVLIVWSLSVDLFPRYFPGLGPQAYWGMGVAGALGLFLSIIFHEFSHSIVARKYGMPMKGITLFIFGGVAEMGDEPPRPLAEFMMAVVGPLSSIFIAGVAYVVYLQGTGAGWPEPLNGILGYLAYINALLAGFNLLPAFPLDGGRILRSILWGARKNLRWATRIASGIGAGKSSSARPWRASRSAGSCSRTRSPSPLPSPSSNWSTTTFTSTTSKCSPWWIRGSWSAASAPGR